VRNANSYPYFYSDTYTNCNRYVHTQPNYYADKHADTNCYSDANRYGHSNTNPEKHSHTEASSHSSAAADAAVMIDVSSTSSEKEIHLLSRLFQSAGSY